MMVQNAVLNFQQDFFEALFDDPISLYAHADQSRDIFNERLSVYRNNVFGSLISVLKDTFPRVCNLLGEDLFRRHSYAFIRDAPPQKGVLSLYGKLFPAFLKSRGESLQGVELATLEWFLQEAYYVEDSPLLCQSDLDAISSEDVPKLIFRPSSALYLVQLDSDLNTCFEQDLEKSSFYQVNGLPTHYVLITRIGYRVVLSWINQEMFDFIKDLARGKPLGCVVEDHLTKYSDFDVTLGLQTCFRVACFSSIDQEVIQ